MLSMTRLKNAAEARKYYEELDDYYAENGLAPSQWFGKAAEELGFQGEVDPDHLENMLDGYLPNGQVLEGAGKNRRIGWDITLSADKSVSIAAGAADRKTREIIIRCHDRAVVAALELLQQQMMSRLKVDGEIKHVTTKNIAAALFRHMTSREQDPDLHTHIVLINITKILENGEFRAINNDVIQKIWLSISQEYQSQLARGLEAAGFEVEQKVSKTKSGARLVSARLAGVSEELVQAMSKRTEQVNQKLEEWGIARANATRAQRDKAVLETRRQKEAVDHSTLPQKWRNEIEELGHELNIERQATAVESDQDIEAHREAAADEAVAWAIAHLQERNSRFGSAEFENIALGQAVGSGMEIEREDIKAAIARAEDRGEISKRLVHAHDPVTRKTERVQGWASKQGIDNERQMLAIEKKGRGAVKPLFQDKERALKVLAGIESRSEYPWTKEQREAAFMLLTSTNRDVILQGSAGVAKTSSVLMAVREALPLADQAPEIFAVSPMARAKMKLGDDIGIAKHHQETLMGYLMKERGRAEGDAPRVIILDEAGLASTEDLKMLLETVEKNGDRVILTGDAGQHGSVGAGEAFFQLQQAGAQTAKITRIFRQRTQDGLEAVYGALAGDGRLALDALERMSAKGLGGVFEIPNGKDGGREARHEKVVAEYFKHDREYRDKPGNVGLIEPSREGRVQVNALVRKGLKEEWTVSGPEVAAKGLESRYFTDAEKKHAPSYGVGDFVVFRRDRAQADIKAEVAYKVVGVSQKRLEVTIEAPSGARRTFRPERVASSKIDIFREAPLPLAKGDRITWTQNWKKKGIANGDQARVQEVRGDKVLVRFEGKGKKRDVLLDASKHITARLAYSDTSHSLQGSQFKHVIANVSSNSPLCDRRLLYVILSRHMESMTLITNSKEGIQEAIDNKPGLELTAMATDADIDEITLICERYQGIKELEADLGDEHGLDPGGDEKLKIIHASDKPQSQERGNNEVIKEPSRLARQESRQGQRLEVGRGLTRHWPKAGGNSEQPGLDDGTLDIPMSVT